MSGSLFSPVVYRLEIPTWLVLGEMTAVPLTGMRSCMQLTSMGTVAKRLIGLLKKFRLRVVRRLMAIR